jgi:hypothetical protein
MAEFLRKTPKKQKKKTKTKNKPSKKGSNRCQTIFSEQLFFEVTGEAPPAKPRNFLIIP